MAEVTLTHSELFNKILDSMASAPDVPPFNLSTLGGSEVLLVRPNEPALIMQIEHWELSDKQARNTLNLVGRLTGYGPPSGITVEAPDPPLPPPLATSLGVKRKRKIEDP